MARLFEQLLQVGHWYVGYGSRLQAFFRSAQPPTLPIRQQSIINEPLHLLSFVVQEAQRCDAALCRSKQAFSLCAKSNFLRSDDSWDGFHVHGRTLSNCHEEALLL